MLLDFGEVVVVCLDVPPYVPYDENVFGINKDGTIRWRIKPLVDSKEAVSMHFTLGAS